MTLVQTAEMAGTTVQQLSRLERGERRLTDDWMRMIALALGVRPADLLPEARENIGEFVQSPAELSLLRFWRSIPISEKRWIIAAARDHGFNLLNDNDGPRNQPQVRRARR